MRRLFPLIVASAASLLGSEILSAQYPPYLRYQNRGSHWEGLRSAPIGRALYVELLSARVAAENVLSTNEQRGQAVSPDRFGVRFFLPDSQNSADVHVTVRQIRSASTFYLLDQVKQAWQSHAVNEYSWPTAPVLKRLSTPVGLDDLGAFVRLGNLAASRVERVLPVVLFERAVGDLTGVYRFAFRTNGRATVTAIIYAGDVAVSRRDANREAGGSPFVVLWRAGSAPEGWYRLVLCGEFEDRTPVDKEILFFHRPQWLGQSRD